MDYMRYMLEVDVMQANELEEASRFVAGVGIPAIVIHPSLIQEAFLYRNKCVGKYKILTAVDWPKGENAAHSKFRNLTLDAIESDGFEIMLSTGFDVSRVIDEMHSLMELSKVYMKEMAEFRFVLGTLHRNIEDVLKICEGVTKLSPKPSVLRTDVNLKPQVSKANPDFHNDLIKSASQYMPFVFKVSGNINTAKHAASTVEASLFAVNLSQAKHIVSELSVQRGDRHTEASK